MNLLQVKQAVFDITARPDKAAATLRAINHRTRLLSAALDSPRDLQESEEDVSSLGATFSLPLTTFANFRKFCYIKPYNRKVYVESIEPTHIFLKTPNCTVEQRDRYYIAGSQVRVALRESTTKLQVGWFAYPALMTLDADTNWLLDADPYAVIEGAAAEIFKEIGDDPSAQLHERLYRDYSSVLVTSFRRS